MYTSQAVLFEELANLSRDYEKISVLGKETAEKILELYCHYRITATLSGEMEVNRTLDVLKNLLQKYFSIDRYLLLLLDENSQELRVRSDFGFGSKNETEARFGLDNELFQSSLTSRKPIYVPDMRKAQALLAGKIALRSGALLCVPLFSETQEPLGLILLARKKPNSFTQTETSLINSIATQVARVLDKILIYEHTRELSITDELTQIFNRRYFNQRFEREMQRAIRYERPLSIIMVDIDYFKTYNDTHGHLYGDVVLQKVAKILGSNLRKADIVARFGGEEFVVLLPEIDKSGAVQVAEKLRMAIESYNFPKAATQPAGRLTISLGVGVYPDDAVNAEDLLQIADRALYVAKENGRNRVEYHKKPRILSNNSSHQYRLAAAGTRA